MDSYVPASSARKTDIRARGYYAALTLMLLISLWLKTAFPIQAVGDSPHDDLLFVRLAAEIARGNWLGDYNNLTHAKGAAFSIFLFANHVIGAPLKFSEHLLYLLAALYFASIIGKIYRTKWAAVATFALLAFIPSAWNPGVGGRVIRENLYTILSLLLLALAIRCFVMSKLASVAEELREKRWFLVLLGLVAGTYWLTREEGIWLLPSVVIVSAFWFWSRRPMLRPWRVTAFFIALALIPAFFVVGTVNSINYFKYGVFRNNDFRSADFQAAYGALSRIKHDQWQRYIIFPKDARERAYRFSPAVKELQPYLEGDLAEAWRRVGCEENEIDLAQCPEILSAWFIFALRDMVAAAGHYRSAREARSFYARLAAEVNAACDQHPGDCLPSRQTLAPLWRDEYLLDTARASWNIFWTLFTWRNSHVGGALSSGNPENLALFAFVTNGPLAPLERPVVDPCRAIPDRFPPRGVARLNLARYLTEAEIIVSTFGVPAALVTCLAWGIVAVRRRRLDAGLVVAVALVAAVGARVILLGFLFATSLEAENMHYLSPVAPMALALVPAALFGVIAFAKKED